MVWVKDASRSVPVAAALLDDEQRPKLLADVEADYDSLRERHAAKNDRPMLDAGGGPREPDADRLGRLPTAAPPAAPAGPRVADIGCPGVQHVESTTSPSCASYIDWQPFFNAWEMKGRFPDILNNPASGETARKLYDDAQEMLDTHRSRRSG